VFHFETQKLDLTHGTMEACLTRKATAGVKFSGGDSVRAAK
jgi:hypothetical protein